MGAFSNSINSLLFVFVVNTSGSCLSIRSSSFSVFRIIFNSLHNENTSCLLVVCDEMSCFMF